MTREKKEISRRNFLRFIATTGTAAGALNINLPRAHAGDEEPITPTPSDQNNDEKKATPAATPDTNDEANSPINDPTETPQEDQEREYNGTPPTDPSPQGEYTSEMKIEEGSTPQNISQTIKIYGFSSNSVVLVNLSFVSDANYDLGYDQKNEIADVTINAKHSLTGVPQTVRVGEQYGSKSVLVNANENGEIYLTFTSVADQYGSEAGSGFGYALGNEITATSAATATPAATTQAETATPAATNISELPQNVGSSPINHSTPDYSGSTPTSTPHTARITQTPQAPGVPDAQGAIDSNEYRQQRKAVELADQESRTRLGKFAKPIIALITIASIAAGLSSEEENNSDRM